MGLLANCSTDEARMLLKKYNYPNAKNRQELELLLAKMYKEAEDKKQIEKDFAEIHPHKNFLKRYLIEEKPKKTEIVAEQIVESQPTKTEDYSTSNCNGNCTCTSCKSNVSGNIPEQTPIFNNNERLMIFGMFGIISILALVIVNQKNK